MPIELTSPSPLSIKQSTLVAAAGEYYVLSRLSLLGKIAAQAPRGVPNTDIIVSSLNGDHLCAVQVKSRQGKGVDRGWHMSAKHEKLISSNLFYAFVDFVSASEPAPVTYIVPSDVVAEALRVMHRAWLEQPGTKGQKHNDSDFRRFMPDYSKTSGSAVGEYIDGWLTPYREAWKLLP